MAFRSTPEEMDSLQLSDNESDDLWNSPSQRTRREIFPKPANETSTTPPARSSHDGETLFGREEAREAALRNELQSVRNINQVIEGLLGSLDRAKGNMDTVSRTVDSASTLLNTWTRILAQTEHNQRLILNPNWQGAVQDVADMENEEIIRQQAAERRERELQQQREAATRRAEEERKRAQSTTTRGARGTTRGRVRTGGLGRTPSVSYSGTSSSNVSRTTSSAAKGSSTTSTRRPASGIARGPGVARGRGRA
ncbi:DASH complex subunit DUO1 [Aspergillus melleus]|uniref:DASH complex subunit DUO1 n=1 Tax=Aspergillus melleus TaxID=138277 RepID=UPI001E8D9A38|nr:uncharacterized protein LDX57_001624 [Aspergillus melleus]KAH8423872.1 hypothetical protein LDX57_001624 [Aspergillus melleus]